MGLPVLNPRAIDPGAGLARRLEFRVLTPSDGDRRTIWDPSDPAQVADAAKRFNELIGFGYRAYAVGPRGARGHRVTSFDAAVGEYLFTGRAGFTGG